MADISFSNEYLDALIVAIDRRRAERCAEEDEAFKQKLAAAVAACDEQAKGRFDDDEANCLHALNRKSFLRHSRALLAAHRNLTADGLRQLYDDLAKSQSGREEGEGQ